MCVMGVGYSRIQHAAKAEHKLVFSSIIQQGTGCRVQGVLKSD